MSEEEKQLTVYDYIDRAEPKFEFAPKGMLFEQEKSYAVQLFAANDYLEKVARQSPISLLSAMANVASVGLSLNPAKKQAYLVPRSGRICLDPSYMGLCDLAIQSGSIRFVQAKVVYENDTYLNKGVDKKPKHHYEAFKDRGGMVGVYCTAKTVDGDYLTTEMQKSEVDDIKGRSELGKKNKGPWVTDYNEMAKKTVVKRAFKLWPKTQTMERLSMAIDVSNQNEEFAPIVNNPEISDYTDDQKKYFDELITKSDKIGMYCFMTSIDQGIQTSLYNSFEKGAIVKYKQLVTGLITKGQSQFADIQIALEEAADTGDDLAAKELINDLSQEVIDYMKEVATDDCRQFIDLCIEEESL